MTDYNYCITRMAKMDDPYLNKKGCNQRNIHLETNNGELGSKMDQNLYIKLSNKKLWV